MLALTSTTRSGIQHTAPKIDSTAAQCSLHTNGSIRRRCLAVSALVPVAVPIIAQLSPASRGSHRCAHLVLGGIDRRDSRADPTHMPCVARVGKVDFHLVEPLLNVGVPVTTHRHLTLAERGL